MRVRKFARSARLAAALSLPIVASVDAQETAPNADKARAGDEGDNAGPHAEAKTTLIPSEVKKLSNTELQILAHIYHADQLEVEAGKLAMEKGTTFAIKSYGKMLVEDHGANARLLLALVDKQDKSLPDLRPMSDADQAALAQQKQTMRTLHGLDGRDFDLAFLRSQIALHDKTLANLQLYVATIKDNPDLVAMLRGMRPVLYNHLQKARVLLAATVEQQQAHRK